jgi:hypothetical protein
LLNAPALSEQRIAEIEETRDGAPSPSDLSGNAAFVSRNGASRLKLGTPTARRPYQFLLGAAEQAFVR